MGTIIVGINGEQGGRDALALARRLAHPGVEVIAVSVMPVSAEPSRATNADFDRALREEFLELLADAREGDEQLRTEIVGRPSVAEGLHTAATRFDAAMLVVGSSRRGRVGRLLLGDDARLTMRDAPCPVAIAPRDYALTDRPIATVGLGWNDQPDAVPAARVARELAAGLGARLTALRVAEPGLADAGRPPLAPEGDPPPATVQDAVNGFDVTTLTGDPIDALAAFAAEVDVLVVGSHQRGRLGRIALGSVSEALAQRSRRPLIVVPRAPEGETNRVPAPPTPFEQPLGSSFAPRP